MEADLAAEHKISRRVGGGLFQLRRGIGDVHIDHGIVLSGVDLKRKAVLREFDFQVLAAAAVWLIELEAGRVQAQAAMLNRTILFDDELAIRFVPRRRHGGREQRRPAGKGKFRAVFALVLAADEGDGVSILLFQRVQRRIVSHIFHRYAAVPVCKGG